MRGRDEALMAAGRVDFGLFERIIKGIYTSLLGEGDLAVDGGAHHGLHSLPMGRVVGPSGRVLAVEPVPASIAILRERLRAARLTNVTIVERALSDSSGPSEYTVVGTATARSGIREVPYPFEVEVERIAVERVRLDELLADARRWRFGKFDLEGGEYHALVGGVRSLRRLRPVLVFERGLGSPAWYGYTPSEFLDLMDDLGYSMYDLFGGPIATLEQWHQPERPWYAIAVGRGSADESLVSERLPVLLDTFAEQLP